MIIPISHEGARLMACPQRLALPKNQRSCIGQECMAWRYEHPRKPKEGDVVDAEWPPKRGYCGLAGA
jgi:hypothetical protein